MATYTTPLRAYIEQHSQFEDGLSYAEKIEIGRTKLFSFDYPFFDDYYKPVFEKNFIMEFYTRDIGFEVEELFKFKLETWLNINMPYYNNLFESEKIKYDPLTNSEMLVAHEQRNDEAKNEKRTSNRKQTTGEDNKTDSNQETTNKDTNSDDNFSRDVTSDTPDSRLQLQTEEGKGVIEYASNIDESKVDNKSLSTGEGTRNENINYKKSLEDEQDRKEDFDSNKNEVEHYLERRFGKIGSDSYSKLVMEYRSSLLRIERDIFREMQELFMLIY